MHANRISSVKKSLPTILISTAIRAGAKKETMSRPLSGPERRSRLRWIAAARGLRADGFREAVNRGCSSGRGRCTRPRSERRRGGYRRILDDLLHQPIRTHDRIHVLTTGKQLIGQL